MSEKSICKYCGMELSEDVPHGLRQCHLSSKTPIENSFYSYAELTEEQKIRFAAYQVFDMPKKASSNIKDTEWLSSDEVQE